MTVSAKANIQLKRKNPKKDCWHCLRKFAHKCKKQWTDNNMAPNSRNQCRWKLC